MGRTPLARTWTNLMAWGAIALLPQVAHSGVEAGAYQETVRLIGSLYLRPEEVDSSVLLRAAARGLADELHWLLVEAEGNTVYLRHGDGTAIGSLSVANMQTLPEALASLEDLVRASGYDLGDTDLRLAILEGVTDGLDRYSTVLSGDRLNRFDERLKGTMVGVGVTMRLRDEQLVVTRVLPDGPASEAGMQVGDRLTRIDGVSTLNMPVREASRRIRGEAGTPLELQVDRKGVPVVIQLERRRIVVPNVRHRVLDDGVGYVKITHFSQRTDENLRLALAALSEAGAVERGLVIDLRRNTGGSMKDSARSADEFVHEGVLLRTVGPDGGTVQNLQSRMDARSTGKEPDVPVIILTDRRTASGSEIMAGALVQLERSALLGTRTFGKGTVQKVYRIDPSARLKLTVARYLLAGDRGISEGGLVPDVAFGDIVLDERGMRYRGFTEAETGAAFDAVTPVVREYPGWGGRDAPTGDVRLEAARKAVLAARGSSRAEVLRTMAEVAKGIRQEQEAVLVEALGAHGIDWTRDPDLPAASGPVEADVRIVATPSAEDPNAIDVRATVANREAVPLEQVVVVLRSEAFPVWEGVALPIGRLGAGETATGVHTVRLRPGIRPREDDVVGLLRVAGRDPVEASRVVLSSRSEAVPQIAVSARLVASGDASAAQVTVHNLSDEELRGVEVHFEHPGELDVELTTRSARISRLAPRGSSRVELGLEVGVSAPDHLPMGLTIEADAYRRLARWPIDLPVDHSVVSLQAPRIDMPGRPLSAPVGPITLTVQARDETRLDHLVVYANGDKIGWARGGRGEAEVRPTFQLRTGENVILVIAEDEHGVVTRSSFRVRGEGSATVDAHDP